MRTGIGLWIGSIFAYLFLYAPLAIVVIYSFNDSKLNAEWVGFTWSWYGKLFGNYDMQIAALNSLFIAIMSSALATMIGTAAGIAMYRLKSKWLSLLVLAPVAMPEILLGVSLLLFFLQVLNLTLGMVSIILAHNTFSIGFVAIIVNGRLAGIDESIFEAAKDLGASSWSTFKEVTFPMIKPAVIAGAVMAFTLSLDDFVITFFTAGVGVSTLPLQIYSMIKIAVTPEVNALSSLLMLLTLSVILISTKVTPDLLGQEKEE